MPEGTEGTKGARIFCGDLFYLAGNKRGLVTKALQHG